VADFLGKTLTEEQVQRLSEHLKFDNFKNNKSVNFEFMKEIGLAPKDLYFMRKGKNMSVIDHMGDFPPEICYTTLVTMSLVSNNHIGPLSIALVKTNSTTFFLMKKGCVHYIMCYACLSIRRIGRAKHFLAVISCM
jgi:hypothetical protein